MGWIVQGIEKVVPQPDEKYKKQPDPEDVTEVMRENLMLHGLNNTPFVWLVELLLCTLEVQLFKNVFSKVISF